MADFIDTVPMTKLDAVNQLFQSIGETPVSSLEITGNAQLGLAKEALNEVNREVQRKGWWFNEEFNYTLSHDSNDYVQVPTNAMRVRVSTPEYNRELVHRGTRLYDMSNHTYSIGESVKVDIVFLLPFEDLPESAREYITVRAARRFQKRQTRSRVLHILTERDESDAHAAMLREHYQARRPNMEQSRAVNKVTNPFFRRPYL